MTAPLSDDQRDEHLSACKRFPTGWLCDAACLWEPALADPEDPA